MSSATPPSRVQIDGTNLTYVEQGNGAPVVLVHGSAADYRDWGQQLGPFSEDYQVVAYSRRYHWPNEAPPTGATHRFLQHVDDLAALIQDLDLSPAHVVGTSYGAMITLTLATTHPDLMRSMVLTEPPLLPWLEDLPGGDTVMASSLEESRQAAGEAMTRGDDEEGMRIFLNGIANADIFDSIPAPLKAAMMDNAAATRLELTCPVEDYFSPVTPEEAEKIAVPTLLLRGGQSPAWLLMIMDELERRMPDADRITIPAANHVPHGQVPHEYNEAVLGFLERR